MISAFRRPVFSLGALVFTLSLLPYLQTGMHDFINLDDTQYVLTCPQVVSGLKGEGIAWAFSSFSYGAIWMPLSWISYMVDVSLWGVHPGPMHLHNAILHACNAVLLFLLLALLLVKSGVGRRRTEDGKQPVAQRIQPTAYSLQSSGYCLIAAALAALFWSLHPLRVEPVAWVASRKDVLSLFWELQALILWVKAVKSGDGGRATGDGQPTAYSLRPTVFRILSIFCFILACLAKPTAMTFPVLAGLLEYLVTRLIRIATLYIPLVIACVCGAIASYSQTAGGAKILLANVPMWGRLLNAIAAVGVYCLQTVLPKDLFLPYLHAWPKMPVFLWPSLVICAVYGALLLWSGWKSIIGLRIEESGGRRRETEDVRRRTETLALPTSCCLRSSAYSPQFSVFCPALFTGLAFFLVAVAPMLGLSNFGFHAHADRFTYLPAIGFSIILAFVLKFVLSGGHKVRAFSFTLVCTASLGLLGVMTWRQTNYWRNEETLFAHTVKMDGSANHVANRNLGIYYYGHGHDCIKAVACFDEAFRVNRERNRITQVFYIFALAESGALDRAKEETRDLVAYKERIVSEAMNKGEMMGQGNNTTRILDTFQAYAIIAYCEGDRALARQHAEYVLNGNPKDEDAHYILGLIERDEGHFSEAVRHWKISAEGGATTLRPYLRPMIAELEK